MSFDDVERYKRLVQALPDIVYELDVNGVITFINDSVSLLGYKPEELIGKHYSVLLHDESLSVLDRDYVLYDYKDVKTGDALSPKLFNERRGIARRTNDLEIRLQRKPGTSVVSDDVLASVISYGEVSAVGEYDASNPPQFSGSAGIIRDITMRRKSEEMLRKLYQAIDQFNSCVFILNRNFFIEYVNPAFFVLTGFVPPEVIGKNIFSYFSFSHTKADLVSKNILDGFESKEDVLVKRSEGAQFWGELSMSPVRSPYGIITHSIAILEDTSSSKMMESLLENTWDLAEEEKTIKSKMMASMSNDLKASSQMLLDIVTRIKNKAINNKDSSDIEDLASSAVEETEQIIDSLNSIDNIVAVGSKTTEKGIQKIRLNVAMERICLPIRSKAETKGLKFNLKLDKDLLIECNPEKMSRAFNIILLNTIKYTKSGYINIESKIHEVNGNVPHLEINIQSSGIVPDKSIIENNNDDNPLDELSENESFAMSIVLAKILIKSIGGEIRISAKDNNSISVIVPVAVPVSENNNIGRYTVLIVDDNEVNLEYMRTLIENGGFRVFCADSAREAFDILNNHYIDVGVFDIIMPICNGIELAEKIHAYTGKKYSNSMPIFAMTAQDTNVLIKANSVFDKVFPKPTDINELIKEIEKAIEVRESVSPDKFAETVPRNGNHSLEYLRLEINSALDALNLAISGTGYVSVDVRAETAKLYKAFKRFACPYGQEMVTLFTEHFPDENQEILSGLLNRIARLLENVMVSWK